jgi:hypothetical protein
MLRLTHNVPSKRGKLPDVKFDNGSLVSTRPGNLGLQLSAAK